jgi:hypothetical protein
MMYEMYEAVFNWFFRILLVALVRILLVALVLGVLATAAVPAAYYYGKRNPDVPVKILTVQECQASLDGGIRKYQINPYVCE